MSTAAQKIETKKIWSELIAQEQVLLREADANRSGQKIFPRTVDHDSLILVASGDWTSGFFPGILWFVYGDTKNRDWLKAAKEFTGLMYREPYNNDSHDVGFKVYNSYGNGYKLTGDSLYRKYVLDGAKTLASRFNSKIGCIRSWNFSKWQFPVIIDNMMNLELLFEATKLSGDSTFYRIAVTHANTTMKNHFRSDFSSFHVVDYDTLTGNVISKTTAQGYSAASAWARGQSWGLYGYTMCYRETRDKRYLEQAEHIASFILNNKNLPADGVPYWDYDVPAKENEPRDVSAAAIMASALYELSHYSQNAKQYIRAADKIMNSLTSKYRSPIGKNHGFLLLHSTGNKPGNSEIDVPIIYADYYYIEALLRAGKR